MPAPIIDCDIHPSATRENPVEQFVEPEYHEALRQRLGGMPSTGFGNPFGVDRRDASCKDPHQTARDHLDRYGISYAVLQSPGMTSSLIHQIDVANAVARGWNEWQRTWLDADERYLGSICVNVNDPAAAVAEIRRIADRGDRVVQVLVSGESRDLYGHRRYWPIYEAASDAGLAFTLHPGHEGVYNSPTPIGRPSTYFEWHTIIPITFQAHLVSLVLEGVFERFPKLKLVLCEGGVFWLVHTLMRMDKNFKALRSTTPWLKRLPSEYVWDHVRVTTQPIEEPARSEHLGQLLEMIHAEKTVCFATDFPHWDFDNPEHVFPRQMDAGLKRRMMYDNAAEAFGLPPAEDIVEDQSAADRADRTEPAEVA